MFSFQLDTISIPNEIIVVGFLLMFFVIMVKTLHMRKHGPNSTHKQ